MTRIVAGRWASRRLAVPAAGTRPTSDRVREAVFAHLAAALGRGDAGPAEQLAGLA
ncbi:MAG: RsmD family RNA methyltransferase, partial [Propionibacteriaceae bacterium]|nr:RsmD family RNA methyltransferase [Propionibacteriaceae bacterium]